MRFTRPLLGATAGALAALALAAPSALAAPDHGAGPTPSSGGAAFVQTDNLAGNAVVPYKRSAQGRLTQAGIYKTGGKGGALEGAKVDFLASQGSLALDPEAGLLFAVNAGSNTITEFGVDGTKLTKEATVPSGGQFPVSIAVRGESLFVLNARGGGSIQGYKLADGKLTLQKGWNRPLGLDPAKTPEFTSTPGQVTFTPDGSKLLVTTKGDTSAIQVFAVAGDGAPAKTAVVTSLPEKVPFAVDFDSAGHLLVAEAGPNALTSYALAGNGSLKELASAPTGQEATCWVTHIGGTFYVSNAASGSVSAFGASGSSLTPLGNTATSPGTVDAAVAGKFLYVQTGGEGVVDEFKATAGGKLTPLGKVTVPGAVGGEGIVAS
jgi:6-phosphogluconolactonase (cycloisomerase 2 family)